MKRFAWAAAVGILLWMPSPAAAIDPWDNGGGDDGSGTDNELASGSEQVHDLQAVGAVADEDWYLVGQQPYSSYEVIADGLTEPVAALPIGGDPQRALQVDLVDSAGSAFSTGYAFSSLGSARSLRFRNATGTEVTNQYVRIRGGANSGCTTACPATAIYRVLLRETTLIAPRFNNSGSQTSFVILQNAGRESCAGSVRFFNSTGTLLGSHAFSLNARGTLVLNTSTVAGVAGQSGSATVDHNARYGALSGKLVALEVDTSFTFDTLFVPKFN